MLEYVRNACSSAWKQKATQYKRGWGTCKGIHRRQSNVQNPPLPLIIRKVHTEITIRPAWCLTPPTPALRKNRQQEQAFESCLSSTVRSFSKKYQPINPAQAGFIAQWWNTCLVCTSSHLSDRPTCWTRNLIAFNCREFKLAPLP